MHAGRRTRVGDRHTAEVGAHADQHEPPVLLDADVVVLGVPQRGQVDALLRLDLISRPARQVNTVSGGDRRGIGSKVFTLIRRR